MGRQAGDRSMKALAAAILAAYKREPARYNAAVAAGLSWLLLKVGLQVDDGTVLLLATSGLTLAAGELTRRLVTPTATVNQVIADETAAIEADWQPVNPNVHKRQA